MGFSSVIEAFRERKGQKEGIALLQQAKRELHERALILQQQTNTTIPDFETFNRTEPSDPPPGFFRTLVRMTAMPALLAMAFAGIVLAGFWVISGPESLPSFGFSQEMTGAQAAKLITSFTAITGIGIYAAVRSKTESVISEQEQLVRYQDLLDGIEHSLVQDAPSVPSQTHNRNKNFVEQLAASRQSAPNEYQRIF
jgi:hypothetical protein